MPESSNVRGPLVAESAGQMEVLEGLAEVLVVENRGSWFGYCRNLTRGGHRNRRGQNCVEENDQQCRSSCNAPGAGIGCEINEKGN